MGENRYLPLAGGIALTTVRTNVLHCNYIQRLSASGVAIQVA